ncbi:hypothetical protein [Bradyrhizobium genosp. SA-3]|uniref:hypothetical protein n=1 Tax=Bradyrhizobium genosp. SA-3 TaxID=508868 RepID=UPI00102A3511|nr:hypothetical protein [Bradyrhizobium genosp. SA-3]
MLVILEMSYGSELREARLVELVGSKFPDLKQVSGNAIGRRATQKAIGGTERLRHKAASQEARVELGHGPPVPLHHDFCDSMCSCCVCKQLQQRDLVIRPLGFKAAPATRRKSRIR